MEQKMGEQVDEVNQPTHELSTRNNKGGLITMPFIIANEALEKVGSYGLVSNMILYLMNDYKIGVAKGTNILFFWSAATNFAPIFGAFLSDSYLGPFLTIGLGSLFSLLGTFLLWLTTLIPQLKPPSCNQLTSTCKQPTNSQFALLIFAFMFISIGAGGVRPCSLAFGAEQIDKKDNPNNKRVLESFFGWYYAAGATAVLIAFTGIVYIQDHAGWKVGFGVPVVLMLLSAVLFFGASSLYVKIKVKKSVFTSFVQVIVVAYKNRKIVVGMDSDRWHYRHKDLHTVPTKRLRFLNKACIIKNPKDLTPDGIPSDPWSLCTVEQVEELKSLIKVLPIWSSGLMMSINVSQSSFPVIQATTMDRHLGNSNFQIPAASFAFFTIATLAIWIILYDRLIIPSASKLAGKQVHLSVKLRMGIGLVISTVAMVISAIVENIRRKKAIEEGLLNDPQSVIKMSAMWLVPQYCLHGLAEAFTAIGQNEFYYSEFPKSMSSTAGSLFLVGMAVANLLASGILSTVENLTKKTDHEGWISTNINKGRYDGYYWILALMSFGNLFYFVLCSWAYGPCRYETVKEKDSSDCSESPRSLACR